MRPELETIFALAGCAERRAALRGMALDALARVDFERLEQTLRGRQLLPLIGTRAIEVRDGDVPDGFAGAVAAALASARAQGLALEFGARSVSDALAAGGIAAMPLKGPWLAVDAHGEIGFREAIDIDLLVAAGDLNRAVDLLIASGYERPVDARRHDGLPDLHFGLSHPKLPRVELHWRVHWYERDFSADMLQRANDEGDLLRPSADDLAASLLLFYARDGFYGVRLAADLAGWWDRHRHDVSGAFLEEHALRYPALAPALTASAIAAEQVAGVPALSWLGSGVAPGHRVAVATRLADWTQVGDIDQLRANVSLVGGLLGPPGSGVDFARRELLPPGMSAGQQLRHTAKILGRYALALWRVRRERPWVELPITH
jgi:hypothetical protein